MIDKNELQEAIDKIENSTCNYQNCEKLATFYTVYDHLYADNQPKIITNTETIIEQHGDSDFLTLIAGKNSSDVWKVIDELMLTLEAINKRLYDGVIRKIE